MKNAEKDVIAESPAIIVTSSSCLLALFSQVHLTYPFPAGRQDFITMTMPARFHLLLLLLLLLFFAIVFSPQVRTKTDNQVREKKVEKWMEEEREKSSYDSWVTKGGASEGRKREENDSISDYDQKPPTPMPRGERGNNYPALSWPPTLQLHWLLSPYRVSIKTKNDCSISLRSSWQIPLFGRNFHLYYISLSDPAQPHLLPLPFLCGPPTIENVYLWPPLLQ